MKKILFLLLPFLIFVACSRNNTTFPEDSSGVYRGELTVGDYTRDAGISVTENGSTVDMFFDNVKFAVLMPVTIDITLKDIPCTNNGVLSFYAENIDPYINKEAESQPSYRFSYISGTVVDNELVLSARMADGLASYVAGKIFLFRGICK